MKVDRSARGSRAAKLANEQVAILVECQITGRVDRRTQIDRFDDVVAGSRVDHIKFVQRRQPPRYRTP